MFPVAIQPNLLKLWVCENPGPMAGRSQNKSMRIYIYIYILFMYAHVRTVELSITTFQNIACFFDHGLAPMIEMFYTCMYTLYTYTYLYCILTEYTHACST